MIRVATLAAIAILLLLACACAVKRPQASRWPSIVLDPACLTAPILMQQCDVEAEPPKCKIVKLHYRRGCERIAVANAHVQ